AFGSATDTGVSGLTNDPNRQEFTVTSAVQSWLTTPSSQHGLMIKIQDESSTGPQDQELWMSPRAAEPALPPPVAAHHPLTSPLPPRPPTPPQPRSRPPPRPPRGPPGRSAPTGSPTPAPPWPPPPPPPCTRPCPPP